MPRVVVSLNKVVKNVNIFFGIICYEILEHFFFHRSVPTLGHEKQKTFIEMQLNSIRNMVSKALSDDEISASEFEKITSQMTKTYRKFEEVDMEIDNMLPKKSESFV